AAAGGGEGATVRREGDAGEPVRPAQAAARLARRGLPEADGAVVGGGGELPAVGRERGVYHGRPVAAEGGPCLPGRGVPERNRLTLFVVGGERLAVGREGQRRDLHLLARQRALLAAGGHVPEADGAVQAAGGKRATVGAEPDRTHRLLV